jgi:hypothetical protein
MKEITLGVADDRVQKIATKSTPLDAIEELIWNAFDADSKKVEVEIVFNELGAIDEILVRDDGTGIDEKVAEFVFGRLGGSPKKTKERSPEGRLYHGKEGEGRYKAFRLGNRVRWRSVFEKKDGKKSVLTIVATADQCSKIVLEEPIETKEVETGVEVNISKINDDAGALIDKDEIINNLTVRLAPYLLGYPDIMLSYDNTKVIPDESIGKKEERKIRIKDGDSEVTANLLLIEWNKGAHRSMSLCNLQGIRLADLQRKEMPSSDVPYSAFLCSQYLQEMADSNLLIMDQMADPLERLIAAAKEEVSGFVRSRTAAKAASLVAKLKQEKIYPFQGKPRSSVESVERQVFDIVAVRVHESLPKFASSTKDQKAFTLNLLKIALESNPGSLKRIIGELLKLTPEQQDEFAETLEYTTIPALLKVASVVSSRLRLISGVEQILQVRDLRKAIKEREHLQKILEAELWLFGEEYSFCSPKGGDITLANVLRAHVHLLRRNDLVQKIDAKSLSDIPDFCLYQQFVIGKPDEYENLVIEIKGPDVKLNPNHISQIKRYAKKVSDEPLFDKDKTRWSFYLISTDYDEFVREEANSPDRRFGHIGEGKNYKIWVKRWCDIMQEAKGRIEFIRGKMDFSVRNNKEGIRYLAEKYKEVLPDDFEELAAAMSSSNGPAEKA